MVFSVDFCIRVNNTFCTIYAMLVHAMSFSECRAIAEEVKEELPANKKHHVHIFIED